MSAAWISRSQQRLLQLQTEPRRRIGSIIGVPVSCKSARFTLKLGSDVNNEILTGKKRTRGKHDADAGSVSQMWRFHNKWKSTSLTRQLAGSEPQRAHGLDRGRLHNTLSHPFYPLSLAMQQEGWFETLWVNQERTGLSLWNGDPTCLSCSP